MRRLPNLAEKLRTLLYFIPCIEYFRGLGRILISCVSVEIFEKFCQTTV